jgi:hypothetical protein
MFPRRTRQQTPTKMGDWAFIFSFFYASITLVVVPLALVVLVVYPICFILSDAPNGLNGNSQQKSAMKDGQHQPISSSSVAGKRNVASDSKYPIENSQQKSQQPISSSVAGTRNVVEQSKKQIGSVSDSKASQPVQDTSQNMEVDVPSPTMQSNSAFHIGTRANRTAKEQQRMDKMHDIFLRVGLMSRQKRVSSQSSRIEKNKGTGGSGRAYNNAQAHETEPSASDLIKSWRTRDQTQPKMIGKLF